MRRQEMRFQRILSSLEGQEKDITRRIIPYRGGTLAVLFIKQLTDRNMLSMHVIRPLIKACARRSIQPTAALVRDEIIWADDCKTESDMDKIEEIVLSGMTVILFSTDDEYLVINLKMVQHRDVPTPDLTYTLRGPKDCFSENLDANLSLMRYRIKDKELNIDILEVGERTKTRVAVMYIGDIANDATVNEIKKRIEAINVDGILESGELQAFLMNNKINLFPQMGIIERSDMASNALLEGRVLTLVDGSGLALVAPQPFHYFMVSCDDRYDNKFFGVFMRLIRYISLFISLTASSVFVAIASFHSDVIPSEYVIFLAETKSRVLFSTLVGAILVEFVVELLREALLRVPKQIGPAIGIVGAIIIGQAAITAGLFSPLLLIIASLSLLASFVIPDYSLMNPIRILKFGLLLLTGMFGFYGFTLGLTFIFVNLVSINSFGAPYMAPYAPFNLRDYFRLMMPNRTMTSYREEVFRPKDKKMKG